METTASGVILGRSVRCRQWNRYHAPEAVTVVGTDPEKPIVFGKLECGLGHLADIDDMLPKRTGGSPIDDLVSDHVRFSTGKPSEGRVVRECAGEHARLRRRWGVGEVDQCGEIEPSNIGEIFGIYILR